MCCRSSSLARRLVLLLLGVCVRVSLRVCVYFVCVMCVFYFFRRQTHGTRVCIENAERFVALSFVNARILLPEYFRESMSFSCSSPFSACLDVSGRRRGKLGRCACGAAEKTSVKELSVFTAREFSCNYTLFRYETRLCPTTTSALESTSPCRFNRRHFRTQPRVRNLNTQRKDLIPPEPPSALSRRAGSAEPT